ncbi:MAG: TonB-dependent receptor plug domain-containing protein [Thermodesulfobium sp.]
MFIVFVFLFFAFFYSGLAEIGFCDDSSQFQEIVVYGSKEKEKNADVVNVFKVNPAMSFSITDYLKDMAGVEISEKSLLGDTGDVVKIRGFGSNRLKVFENGRDINATGVYGGFYVDWSTIPPINVDSIKVVKSGVDAKLGVLGGAVEIKNRVPTGTPITEFFGSYGTRDTQNYRFYYENKIKDIPFNISIDHLSSDPFLRNNDFLSNSFNFSTVIPNVFDGQINASVYYTKVKRGLIVSNRKSNDPQNPLWNVPIDPSYPTSLGEFMPPGGGPTRTPVMGAYWQKEKTLLDLSYEREIFGWKAKVAGFTNREDRYEVNPGLLIRDLKPDKTDGFYMDFSRDISKHHVRFGYYFKNQGSGDTFIIYEKTNPATYNQDSPSSQKIIYNSAYLDDRFKISKKSSLYMGVRYDSFHAEGAPILQDGRGTYVQGISLTGDAITPRISLDYELTKNDTATLSVFKSARMPTNPEYYWWLTGYSGSKLANGAPAPGYRPVNYLLRPEKENAVELGIKGKRFGFDYSINGYYYSIHDYIMFRIDPNPTNRVAYNVDEVNMYGAETTLKKRIKGIDTVFTYTYQRSTKVNDALDTQHLLNGLDYFPRSMANLTFQKKFDNGLILDFDNHYVSKQNLLYAPNSSKLELVSIKPYYTADLGISYLIPKHDLRMDLMFYDIFNKKYQEVFGYPMPGRSVFGSLTLTF